MTSTTDPDGNTTSYSYDGLNRLVKTTDALGNTTSTQYDALGDVIADHQPIGPTSPRTNTTTWAARSRKSTRRLSDGLTGRPVTPTTTYTYDANGNLLSTTDPDGDTTWTVYDALNRVVRSLSCPGQRPQRHALVTTTTYDAVGNVLSVTDPDGNVTSYVYDRLNRQVEVINPLRNTSSTVYDADGDLNSDDRLRRQRHPVCL